MRQARYLVVRAAWVLVSTLALTGQVGTQGAILGEVRDSSGAAIPGAVVSVKNLDTGLTQERVTDQAGNFEILALPIGPYSVTVSLSGFQTWRLAKTEITVGARTRISPVLHVGDITEEVSVEAAPALLQTERSAVQTTVQLEQIRELPLSTRNPVVLVNLVPGMRFTGQGGPERGSTVQGFGLRSNQTEFQIDGLNANAAMDEGGMAIPNVDTIAEFSVETSSFSAEHGRNPLQIVMATKSGSNRFQGSVWEFVQNDALNARNAFALDVPKLRRNQFGGAVGGPIVRDSTFFFGSFEHTPVRGESIYNAPAVSDAMLEGDFSALPTPILDPATGQPFPGNVIPGSRISNASRSFFPYLLRANSPDGTFRDAASTKDDTSQYALRIDHQITNRQRIYGRWMVMDNQTDAPGYSPDARSSDDTRQHNVGVNYTLSLGSSMLLTATAGYLRSDNRFTSPLAGTENLAEQAGIRGIATEGREDFVGIPNVGISGYTGFNTAFGVPGRLWSDVWNTKTTLTWIKGAHSLSVGYEYNDRSVFGRHGSHSPRGTFDFNGQYTSDGFADFLLGLTSGTRRNFPLETFGLDSSPYSGAFIQDFWTVAPTVTVSLGLRYERWQEKTLVNGNGSTFDPTLGQVIAAVDEDGAVNLGAQPVAPFLAAATEGLWVPASEVGVPPGLFEASNNLSPRLGVTWRPEALPDVVVRAGYGVYYNTFTGNRSASSIVGLPYWTWETLAFSPVSPQRWETAWPEDPDSFVQPSVGESPAWNIDPARTHEWNVTIQQRLPLQSALTISYVGARVRDQVALTPYNEVPPGRYPDLQAAKPYPAFGEINMLENVGRSWYNGLQVKWERRFADGLSFTGSYSFAKDIADSTPDGELGRLVPFAPSGYLRGRSAFDRTHIFVVNAVYELPIGRGRRFLSDLNPVADAIFGGWQLSGINSFLSGTPLTFSVPGSTLGNGWDTRPNLVGDPSLADPGDERWFDPAAFEAPAPFRFGDSGIGILDGPGTHILDVGLMKSVSLGGERRLQLRWEVYNALNHVNLENPETALGTQTFGRILGAGGARTMQLGVKVTF